MWGIIPFGEGLALTDFSMGMLYTLTLSSLGVYGILFSGWSANSTKIVAYNSIIRVELIVVNKKIYNQRTTIINLEINYMLENKTLN